MSSAEDRNWQQLFKRLDERDDLADKRHEEMREAIGTLKTKCAQVEGAMVTTGNMAADALCKAEAACKWTKAHDQAHLGDNEQPPSHWIANALAYAAHFPRRALLMLVVWVGVPAAFTCALLAYAGPGGGLRLLLQQAGLKALYVPTPEPPRAP